MRVVAGSALAFIIWATAAWSTAASNSRCQIMLFHRPILTSKPVISNSVTLYHWQASGRVLLAKLIKQGLPSWTCHKELPVPSLLVSE